MTNTQTHYYEINAKSYSPVKLMHEYIIEAGSLVEAQFKLQSILNNEKICVSNYPHIFYYQIDEKQCFMYSYKRHVPYCIDDVLTSDDFNILETTTAEIETISAVIIKD